MGEIFDFVRGEYWNFLLEPLKHIVRKKSVWTSIFLTAAICPWIGFYTPFLPPPPTSKKRNRVLYCKPKWKGFPTHLNSCPILQILLNVFANNHGHLLSFAGIHGQSRAFTGNHMHLLSFMSIHENSNSIHEHSRSFKVTWAIKVIQGISWAFKVTQGHSRYILGH